MFKPRILNNFPLRTLFKILFPVLIIFFAVLALNGNIIRDQILSARAQTDKFDVGDTRIFHADNRKLGKKNVKAQLVDSGKYIDLWFDSSSSDLNEAQTNRLVQDFDRKIYKNNKALFGAKENSVPKVTVVVTELGETYGYFSPTDMHANGSYLFFVDNEAATGNYEEAVKTVTHEFAHILYYLSGRENNEELDEQMAIYAERHNSGQFKTFKALRLKTPDTFADTST